MTSLRLRPATRTALAVALAAWLVLLAGALLAPSAAGPSWLVGTVADLGGRLGLPSALVAPERVEFALNVFAFVPVSFLGSLLWLRPTWRDWTAGGFVASFLVEVVQAVALDDRSATYKDVVSNTLGALVGAALAAALVLALRARETGPAPSEGGADLPDRDSPAQQDQLPG